MTGLVPSNYCLFISFHNFPPRLYCLRQFETCGESVAAGAELGIIHDGDINMVNHNWEIWDHILIPYPY
jgi:hypothetical protein